MSRYIQNRPRSRYSHPCAPKKDLMLGARARGSSGTLPPGYRRRQPRVREQSSEHTLAARLAPGDQRREEDPGGQVGRRHKKIAIWRCQVRVRLYGKYLGRSIPKKPPVSTM